MHKLRIGKKTYTSPTPMINLIKAKQGCYNSDVYLYAILERYFLKKSSIIVWSLET